MLQELKSEWKLMLNNEEMNKKLLQLVNSNKGVEKKKGKYLR